MIKKMTHKLSIFSLLYVQKSKSGIKLKKRNNRTLSLILVYTQLLDRYRLKVFSDTSLFSQVFNS